MIRNILIGLTGLAAVGALMLAFVPREFVAETPTSVGAAQPSIVISAETMADVLTALDLERVEIVHE